ncbi:MAG TPA: response regulator transcription factor [Candidatus Babeliaceae bacterium]|nr:response regulator transcription factor [Candidatus Babeliaceae bacterium]
MPLISYIIAEDHKIFRKGLRDVLNTDHKLKRAGEAGTGVELMQLLTHVKADVVLLDLNMPEMDGIEAAIQIRRLYPEIKLIVITMYDDEDVIMKMLDIGVNGYLTKKADADEIISAVHAVYEKEHYFNDTVSTAMLKNLVHKNKLRQNAKQNVVLNDKEKEILQLICHEHTNAEIAEKVYLSTRTVEGIRSSMIEKIGVRNTAGLVIYALKNGVYKD